MAKAKKYFNRELSWLDFNQRVLEEAKLPQAPLLERLKFLAITASNQDEFFMVRVGGLQLLRKAGKRRPDPCGLTPVAQLKAIGERVHRMVDEQYQCYTDVLEPALDAGGIHRIALDELNFEREQYLSRFFAEQVYPVLTPMKLAADQPFPVFHGLELYSAVRLSPAKAGEGERYAVIPLGRALGRFVVLPSEQGHAYVLIEDVVRRYVEQWFPGMEVLECRTFRVTRNADIAVREDEAGDLLSGMASILEERRFSDCVRLEIEHEVSNTMLSFLRTGLNLDGRDVFKIRGPVNLKDFMRLSALEGFDSLRVESWQSQPSAQIDRQAAMFEQIAERDILLYHPYESFDPVVRLIEEASTDPDVLAIKQVLYRTSSNSPIIAALAQAAEEGKSVTVLVELKARFDEERNIGWAQRLEQAGVQVVYGVQGLKTHAKVCVIVRRETQGIVRYVHYGTGNYNDATARLYGDISFMSCDEDLGYDASVFFNSVCGYSQPTDFRRLSMAPLNIRSRLIELIDGETERCKQGQKGMITAKMNSLVDAQLIDRLYKASQAGVRIKLNVRGICCLRPGVKGLSQNISVISIVDRYLEHARIFSFHHGGDPRVYISSADLMPRNLDRRVELLVPIDDPRSRRRLIEVLKIHLNDNVKSWTLQADGTYERTAEISGKKKKVRSQKVFYDQACEEVRAAGQTRRTRFEPHRADKKNRP